MSGEGFALVSESLSDSTAWNLHLRVEESTVDAEGGVNPLMTALVLCFSGWTGPLDGSRHLRLSTPRVLRRMGRVDLLVVTPLVAIELFSLSRGLLPSSI